MRRSSRSGLSLMEVMITLAILALAATIVGPGLSAGLRSAGAHAATVELDQQILTARRAAMTSGVNRALVRDHGETPEGSVEAAVSLPDGWSYMPERTLLLYASGGCDDGVLMLRRQGGAALRFVIEAPRCRPSLVR